MKKYLKMLYSIIPFKRELYSLIKAIKTPQETIYRHLHFKGAFLVKINDQKKFRLYNETFIENEIFWEGITGRWEKESMKLWIQLSKDSRFIIDIGANTGVYSLVAKTMNPDAEVFAFEPHPLFFEMLLKNVKINNININCINKAVSNFDGELTIEDYSGATPTIKANSVTLDKFIEQNKLKSIDLIKIDVETFEPQVMQGFSQYLSQYRPTILIEILNEEVAQSINNMVSTFDYLYFNIDELGSVRQTTKIEKSDYYNYLLCNKMIAAKLGLNYN
ncbi:MAG: FkbM family methyltransferase [Bacteroidetes bacterium]|nr:FkbM family methyltransferase [Bacteroidota bacterium]